MRIGSRRKSKESFIAILICLSLALLIGGMAQQRRVYALTLQVNAAYQKAFYETLELMDGLQLNLEKLMVSGNGAQEQLLLSAVARQAEGAQDNLSAMPDSREELKGALKFVNQTGDYARVLNERLAAGGALTADDMRQLASLHTACADLNGQLLAVLDLYERGEAVFIPDIESAQLADTGEEEVEPSIDYPVLLYDGPFSDAQSEQTLNLTGAAVDQQEAERRLVQFLGEERVQAVRFAGESNILSLCYEFELTVEEGTLTAGVTQAGGHILYILPDQGETEVLLSQAECIDLAAQFLRTRGYGDMSVSYWRQLDGILTVNFAAVQDSVLLYPDLVKLQISMKSGLVVGLEATNYLRNHTERALVEPLVSREDALALVRPGLQVSGVLPCIIPTDGGEAQCWEISASLEGGGRYLIYIDILTGQERTILHIVEGSDGIVTR